MTTVTERVLEALQVDRGRVVLSGRFGEATAGEMYELVSSYADGFAGEGIGSGDSVGVSGRPGPRTFAALLAATGTGARAVLIDPRMGHEVASAHVRAAGVDTIVAEAILWRLQTLFPGLARRRSLVLPRVGRRLSLGGTFATGATRLGHGAPAGQIRASHDAGRDAERDSLVIFTSGTTSAPRGVVHSNASILAGVDAVTTMIRPRAGSIVCGAQFFVLLPALCAGARVHVLDAAPRRAARELAELRPDVSYLTPPALRAVLAARREGFHGRVFTGSAPASSTLLTAAKRAGFSEAWDVYALTEAFPVSAAEADEKTAWEASHPHDGLYLGALAQGLETGTSEIGELLLRGPNVARAYLDPVAGRTPIEWLGTGDRGRATDGRVVLSGRLKDMFLIDAENIYPSLYEPRFRVPGVGEVVLAGIGPDADDQVPVLLVEADGTVPDDDLKRTLTRIGRDIGRARPVHIVFGEIPRSGRNNKVDRAAASVLADRLAASAVRR